MYAPRILLIEADEDTHRALRTRLEQRGCEVFAAKSQAEAVRRAGETEADLVVQERAVSRPWERNAFDEVMDAVELLAGPFPCGAPSTPPLGRHRVQPRAHRLRALVEPAGSR
ncbi:MAG TPA: hypothetical protein VGB92_10770 [Longimicrobium sp.]|jgi:hypothetical protein